MCILTGCATFRHLPDFTTLGCLRRGGNKKSWLARRTFIHRVAPIIPGKYLTCTIIMNVSKHSPYGLNTSHLDNSFHKRFLLTNEYF